MAGHIIEWARREKRRAVNAAVGRSFAKTATEPLTNADSNLKTMRGVAQASGLVERMLSVDVGHRLDTSVLKRGIPAQNPGRRIDIFVSSAGHDTRTLRIIDPGTGMSADVLRKNFGTYAEAKAKGQRTRSLFGRGALDVLLYHEDSVIFSVHAGALSRCQVYWNRDGDPICDVKELGPASPKLLRRYGLPLELKEHGTVFQVRLKEGTAIPHDLVPRLSSFYMLRLIAADPNLDVVVRRKRSDGVSVASLRYDFPLGTVIGKGSTKLTELNGEDIRIDVLVAASDVALDSDASNLETRANGLLFVDENDAVLDLTLLPEHDGNPYLRHVYGVVRLTGIRAILERKLEDAEAEAVLTPTRDGFDRKNALTTRLFSAIDSIVRPIYEAEEKRQRSSVTERSEELQRRVNQALDVLSQFKRDETEDEDVPPPPKEEERSIFAVPETVRLVAGKPRRISFYVRATAVNAGERIAITSSSDDFAVSSSELLVRPFRDMYQRLDVFVVSETIGMSGLVAASCPSVRGEPLTAAVSVTDVLATEVERAVDTLEFASRAYRAKPNVMNTATLLINPEAFPEDTEISVEIVDPEGDVSLENGGNSVVIPANLSSVSNVVRIPVRYTASGWGQTATLRASAAVIDDEVVEATCRVQFEDEREPTFDDFEYIDLGKTVLGDVSGDKLYVNAGYAYHKRIFGATRESFDKALEEDPVAQARAAAVMVEAVVYYAATSKYFKGGKKGLYIDREDPITGVRKYLDESRSKLESKVLDALTASREV